MIFGFAFLSDEVVESLAQEEAEDGSRDERERRALDSCMEKLPAKDRELVRRRYYEAGTMSTAPFGEHRSIHMMYKSLVRIRRRLLECIQRTLGLEGGV